MLVTDSNYLPVLLTSLDHAQSSVDLLAFSFAIGSASGRLDKKGATYQIAAKLAEVRQRGVKVRVYMEGRRETALRNRVTAAFLRKAGIQIKMGASHAKGFCIDKRYVLFGSTNLTNMSLLKNHETNVLLDDPQAAEQFGRYFEHLWKGGTHGGIELDPPMVADGGFLDLLLQMIGSAKTRLEFSIYFFHHPTVEKAFIQAHKRGVQVTGFINQHKSFALPYVRRTRSTIKRLRAAGLEDLHFDRDHMFTHSKYLIKDRKEIALGTGNWLSEDVLIHPQLYIHLSNPSLARQLAKHLQRQIANESSEE